MPRPKSYKTKEAAAYLGIGRDALETAVKKGLIARFKIGGLWCYDEEDLDTYYRSQREKGLAEAEQIRSGKNASNVRTLKREPITRDDVRKIWRGG